MMFWTNKKNIGLGSAPVVADGHVTGITCNGPFKTAWSKTMVGYDLEVSSLSVAGNGVGNIKWDQVGRYYHWLFALHWLCFESKTR